MLSKLLSEKDMEIHKFVNNLEVKLQEKETLLLELKAQKEELQSDFTYNLSLLKSRDSELVQLEKVIGQKDYKLKEKQEEIQILSAKLKEEEEKSLHLKNYLKEQEEIYSLNISKTKQDFKEKFYTRDKQELVFTEKIQELAGKLKEKEEEICQEIHRHNFEQKNNSDKNLLEILNIRACFQEELQILKDNLKKQEDLVKEKEFLLQDLTLQNDLKFKKILKLEQDIIDLKNAENDSEIKRGQLVTEISQLESRIEKIEKENHDLISGFEIQREENTGKIKELDEIISGLSQRNEYLKNDFTDKISLKEEELKDMITENKILLVKLDQEKSIKAAEKEMYLKNQEEISMNLKVRNGELQELKDKFKGLETDFGQKSNKLDNVCALLRDLEMENHDLKRKISFGILLHKLKSYRRSRME